MTLRRNEERVGPVVTVPPRPDTHHLPRDGPGARRVRHDVAMVKRSTRALRPGDRVTTGPADHDGVVLRPLRVTLLPLTRLHVREVARVALVGPTLTGRPVPGLTRLVVTFSDGARSQPVAASSTWPLVAAGDEQVGAGSAALRRPLTSRAAVPDLTGLRPRRGAGGRSPRRRRPAARGTAARAAGTVSGPRSR